MGEEHESNPVLGYTLIASPALSKGAFHGALHRHLRSEQPEWCLSPAAALYLAARPRRARPRVSPHAPPRARPPLRRRGAQGRGTHGAAHSSTTPVVLLNSTGHSLL